LVSKNIAVPLFEISIGILSIYENKVTLVGFMVLNTEYPAILLIAGNTTLSLSAFKVRTMVSPG
jgi:hypothetical protein